jgi:UDP-N-acetylmuramyl pentapeptide phosphotransferase/UDP-N-acetylglucosamine-1-phosphate transferase
MIDSGKLLLAVDVGAFLAAWAVVLTLIRLAPRIGLLDRPNERSLHTRVTPRGGGLGFVILVAIMLGAFLVWMSVVLSDVSGWNISSVLGAYLGPALFVAAVSLRDDFKSLSPGLRFICQLAAALIAVLGVGWFRQVIIPVLGIVDLGWFGAVLTVIWIVGMTNVYNFMDGIDGIAGVQGAIAGLAWAIAGAWLQSPVLAMLGLMLAGGCAGFLVHNWPPAEIFMGDVGSAFLGFSFAVVPLIALRFLPETSLPVVAGSLPLFALLSVWPFVGDGFYTFLRRLLRREQVWKPHRSHLYQRLVQSGWSHARVSSLYAIWCVVSAQIGMFWLKGIINSNTAFAFMLVSLAGMVALSIGRERKKGADKLVA